jgi:hypothetical protein
MFVPFLVSARDYAVRQFLFGVCQLLYLLHPELVAVFVVLPVYVRLAFRQFMYCVLQGRGVLPVVGLVRWVFILL